MRNYLFFLFVVAASMIKTTNASAQIADFFGEWRGYLTITEGEKSAKYKLTIDFKSPSKNVISGTVTLYHDYDSNKVRATSEIAFNYQKSINSIYYFGMAKTLEHKECSGNYIYIVDPNNKNIMTGTFKPLKKGCVQADIKLFNKYPR